MRFTQGGILACCWDALLLYLWVATGSSGSYHQLSIAACSARMLPPGQACPLSKLTIHYAAFCRLYWPALSALSPLVASPSLTRVNFRLLYFCWLSIAVCGAFACYLPIAPFRVLVRLNRRVPRAGFHCIRPVIFLFIFPAPYYQYSTCEVPRHSVIYEVVAKTF